MSELPNGFKYSRSYGGYNLAGLGIGYWARRDEPTFRELSLMTTDYKDLQVLVASCIVGALQDVAEKINKSEKAGYDNIFYRMAYMVATHDFGDLKKLQAPKYFGSPIHYFGRGSRRVWAVLGSSISLGISDNIPLVVRIAQTQKSQEESVMGVISSSTRRS